MNLTYDLKLAIPLTAVLLIGACGGGSDSKLPPPSEQSGPPIAQPTAAEPTVAEQPAVATEVSYECPDDLLTMIDICLGMPPEQVKAVLLKRDPDTQISERLANFSYSDGAEKLSTDPYIDRIRAETASDEYYEFYFSAPPGEGKLVYMSRGLGSEANPPPIGSLMAALEKNYGAPTFRHRGQMGGTLVGTLRWDFPKDRVSCSEAPQEDSGLVLEMGGRVSFSNFDYQIEKVRKRGVEDPADCAAWLQVYIQTFNETDPVRSADMTMTDFATGVAEAKETLAWLEQLEAQARADRLENAEVPDF